MLGTILGNVDEITLGINVGTELGSVNGYIDSSNDGSLIIKPTLEHLGMACMFLGYEQNHMDGTYRMLNWHIKCVLINPDAIWQKKLVNTYQDTKKDMSNNSVFQNE